MQRKFKTIAGSAVVVTVIGIGGGAALAGSNDGNEATLSGSALNRASAAALAHTGGGRVTQTEVGDEESYYEVEVTRADGSQVDVQLNKQFKVVGDKVESGEDPSDDNND